jgi:hypothetical protein
MSRSLLAKELVEKVLHIDPSRFRTILDFIQGVLHLGLCRFPSFLNHLDLWLNPERFELGCQPFGPLAFLLSAQAFSLY